MCTDGFREGDLVLVDEVAPSSLWLMVFGVCGCRCKYQNRAFPVGATKEPSGHGKSSHLPCVVKGSVKTWY